MLEGPKIEGEGVVIGRRCLLKSTGPVASYDLWPCYVKFEFYTSICSASIIGKQHVDLYKLDEFCASLKKLHQSLSGAAVLEGEYNSFSIKLNPSDNAGHIKIEYLIGTPYGDDTFKVNFVDQIDQSYLPQIIRDIRQEFKLGVMI